MTASQSDWVCLTREDETPTNEDNSDKYRKLAVVLTNILRPDFKTLDAAVLDKLLTLIRSEGKRSQENQDILLPTLHKWLTKASENWLTVVPKSIIFVLKIAGYVVETPQGFLLLSTSGVLENLLSRFEEPCVKKLPLELAFIDLLIPLATHREGSNFITQKGLWKKAVAYAASNDNCYTFRKYSNFLANFLKEINDDVPLAIFQHVVDCLTPHLCLFAQSPHCGESSNIEPEAKIVRSLSMCRLTLLALMENDLAADKLRAQCEFCDIAGSVSTLCNRVTNKEMLREATKLLCTLHSLEFYQTKDTNGLLPVEVAERFIDLILTHTWLLVTRHLFDEVLEMCTEYHTLLHKFGALVCGNTARDSDGRPYDVATYIDNLLFMIQGSMGFMCFRPFNPTKWNGVMEDYIDKLYRITDNRVMRNCYLLRDALITVGDRIWPLGIASIKRFTLLCPIVGRELGLLVFQEMAHLLGQCTITFPWNNSAPSTSVSTRTNENESGIIYYPAYTSSCLVCIHAYMSRFKFTWRDSLECLNILDILQALLECPLNTWRLIVDILKTIGLVLQNFMPPNLALLTNTLEGSGTENLGPQLVNLLSNEEWAVRDSALEVIKIIIQISSSRFPAFQTMLIDHKIPQTIFDMVQNDEEPFVRSMALSCLYELADVPDVWGVTLNDKNVVESVLLILHYEPEAVVRKMAVETMGALVANKTISRPSELEAMYKSMYSVSLNDLHWEVRSACMDFWKTACCQIAENVGCVSGVFPEVIFSKEKKRIIVLTPQEITRTIMKCLDTMESHGILYIIWEAFTNDSELGIAEKAGEFVKNIRTCRSMFNYTVEDFIQFQMKLRGMDWKCIEARQVSTDQTDGEAMEIAKDKETTSIDVDSAIEDTISQQDSDLLMRLEVGDRQDIPRTLPHIHPILMSYAEFAEKSLHVDVPQFLKDRFDWLNNIHDSLDSLLDDIVSLEGNTCNPRCNGRPINVPDCY